MKRDGESNKRPRFVSLYTGAGGLDLGFIAAGFEPVFSNDMNPDAMKTYGRVMDMVANRRGQEGDHRIVVGDINEASEDDLPLAGCADIVIGGPPCQGFSVAGKMNPQDPRSRHVFEFLSVVDRVRPKAFVMENVKALAMTKNWSGVIDGIREKAAEIGYKTFMKVLNASDYGVAQKRERMFLVGFADDAINYSHPEPTVSVPVTVGEVLRTLPRFGQPGNDQACNVVISPYKKPVIGPNNPYSGFMFNGRGRVMNLDAPAPTIPASGGNSTPIVDEIALLEGGKNWIEGYHAHLLVGGEVLSKDKVPGRLRRITVEEAAAIQSFPRDMPWFGSHSSRMKQIGNAVPPKMAYAVAMSVAKALGIEVDDDPDMLDRLGRSDESIDDKEQS